MPGPNVPVASVVASAREIIHRAGTMLDRRGDAYEAAVFLLTSRWLGQNVDRLARVTGVSGAQAARYARRLYDNGIWHEGGLVRSWDDELSNPDTFWADVLVARGLAHRRGAADGLLEWAPVGSWWKSFELTPDPGAMPATNAYQARVEAALPSVAPEPGENVEGFDDETDTASRVADLFPRADWLR